MASFDHEIVVDLFREAPELLPHLLAAGLRLDMPSFATAAIQDSVLTQAVPVEYRADLIVTLHDDHSHKVVALVLEVQRHIDPDKRFTWPLYLAAGAKQVVVRSSVQRRMARAGWAIPARVADASGRQVALLLRTMVFPTVVF